MVYVINKAKQIISIFTQVIVTNETGALPVKIYGSVVQMDNGKLYNINSSNIISNCTLIELPHNYNNTYVVQHFLNKFVIINGELFHLRTNILHGPFFLKPLGINNVHNLDNVKIYGDNYVVFVNSDNNLMLKKDNQFFLLDKNICCNKLQTDYYIYSKHAFFVTLYYDHKIIICNYKKSADNNSYCLICEHEIQLEICIKEVYSEILIDTCGQVYDNIFNITSSQCLFHSHCKTVNKMKRYEIDAPIKEIFYYEGKHYYLSYDGRIIDLRGFTIANNILGSCVPNTNTKSANF